MTKIAVCDDNQQFLGTIVTCLHQLENKYQYEMDLEEYSSGEELIEDIDRGLRFDVIYMDIEMKDMDGMDTAAYIRERDDKMLLIYVSSHEEYMRKLFETEPFRFLSKPVSFEEFEHVFLKAMQKVEYQKKECYYFQSGKNVMKVLVRDILYFESSGRKVIVHTKNHDYTYYDKLGEVEKKVEHLRFVRIHKAYLVNMDNIEAFQYERIALVDGTILSISEKNRPKIRSQFWDYCRNEGNT